MNLKFPLINYRKLKFSDETQVSSRNPSNEIYQLREENNTIDCNQIKFGNIKKAFNLKGIIPEAINEMRSTIDEIPKAVNKSHNIVHQEA